MVYTYLMDTKRQFHCPVEATISVLEGKWKLLIIRELMKGTRRFSQIQRAIPSVTQKMLTKQLRELERDGLISRKVYPQVPPKVEYSLTEIGRELESVLEAMHRWGERYISFTRV